MDWGYQNFDATSMLVLWDRGRWTSLAFWKAAGSENEKSDGSERGLGCLWVGTKISKLSPIFVLFSSPRIRRIQQVHPRICTVPLKAYPFLSDIHDISPALSNLRARVLWLEGWGPAFSCAATTTGHRLLREGANILGGYWWGSHCAIWIVSSTSLEKAEAAFITTQCPNATSSSHARPDFSGAMATTKSSATAVQCYQCQLAQRLSTSPRFLPRAVYTPSLRFLFNCSRFRKRERSPHHQCFLQIPTLQPQELTRNVDRIAQSSVLYDDCSYIYREFLARLD